MAAPHPSTACRSMHLTLSASAFAQADGGARLPLAPRDAAMLAWLALEGPTPRARVAALLWPDSDADAARNALRQRLFQLRKQIGVDLVTGSATLALAEGVAHDLEQADQVLGDGPPVVAGEFADWLAQQRRRRQTRLRQSLVDLAQMAESAGDWADAMSHAQELLALEPLSEEAHRRLIRLHYLAGDRASALLAFDRCEQLLKDEIGARPSAETLALLATIEAGTTVVPAVGSALPASVLRPPRMIGRDRELGALAQGWRAGQVVAVIGEAGLGKTRLLQTFIDGHPGVVRAAGRPGDAGVPFATLARLLRAVLALTETAPDALALPSRGEIARVLPEFDGGGARPAGEGQRLQLQRALRSLLDSQPELSGLIVDDLHFADEASLEMLGALIDPGEAEADAATALRWALAYRPAEAGSPVQALHDGLVEQTRLAPLVLAPLDEAALAELVDSLGLPGVDGRALAPGLRRRTGGNPLFVLETLKQAWVERTLAQLADTKQLPRPVSVGRLIERRVAQLSPGALALARVASIAGVDFDIALAEHVLGVSAMQFADALNELEAAQVLRGTQFAHDLVHDAVQGSVPQAIARHTHGQVAQWLEQHGGEAARIAAHFIAAGRDVQALSWLQQAADRAGVALRRREQIDFLDTKSRIEEQLGEGDAAFETLMRVAEIEVTLDAAALLETSRCDRLDRLARDVTQRVRARTQRSNLAVMRGAHAEAAQVGESALREALREQVAPKFVAQCRIALGTALSSMDRTAEALVHFEAALGWVVEHAGDELRCEFHGNLATTYDRLGRLADGAAHHRTALRLAQTVDDYTNGAICLSNLASNRSLAGDAVEADALLEQAKRVYAQAAEPSSIAGFIAIEHAVVHRQRGHYARALREIDEGLENLRRFAPGYVSIMLAHQAACWSQLGQWARLEQTLTELDRSELPSRTAVRMTLLRREMDIALGRRQDAEPLRRSLESIAIGTTPAFRHMVQIELAALDHDRRAMDQLRAVVEEAKDLGNEATLIVALARAAGLALDLDDRGEAQSLARAAWAMAGRVTAVAVYPLDPWWHCARVFEALRDESAAVEVTTRATAWIDRSARIEVPDGFRDSFLERNPVNRALRALAARHRAGA